MKMMKKKVLCIEQNYSLGFVIKTVLSESFNVINVPNAFDAMNELSQEEIDCIILSVEQKNVQSLELLKHLHSSSLLKDIPVVVISDYEDEKLKSACIKHNVSETFKKPFDPLKLLESIRVLCSPVDTTQILFKKRKVLNLN